VTLRLEPGCPGHEIEIIDFAGRQFWPLSSLPSTSTDWIHPPVTGTLIIRRPLRSADERGGTGTEVADFTDGAHTVPLDGGDQWFSMCPIS
jgi:hypothetical protein